MSFGFVLREAVASCALSHGSDCGCIVCRAADGDLDAFGEIAVSVQRALTDSELRAMHRGTE